MYVCLSCAISWSQDSHDGRYSSQLKLAWCCHGKTRRQNYAVFSAVGINFHVLLITYSLVISYDIQLQASPGGFCAPSCSRRHILDGLGSQSAR